MLRFKNGLSSLKERFDFSTKPQNLWYNVI